uniref:DUF5681 domain-containing protein n=2 Tax=viral metagenome TaxID=1070528 RepID=A0A6M3ISE9_9ZZZZ
MANPNPNQSTRWKKGSKSPNPKGRPEQPWKAVFRKEVEKLIVTKSGKKEQIKHLIAKAQIAEALKGNTYAFNAVADRMEGRPVQPTDLTSQGEKIEPIQVIIVEDKHDE